MTTSLDFGVAKEMALVEAKIRQSIVSEEPLLHDIARYVIDAGGKRIRPMVTLLAFRALGGTDVSQAIDLAAALELIHSATLIHDDINDGGEMRRGRLTAYKKFGLQNALITGDFLFVKAFGIGGKFDAEIVELTADACAALAEGEIRQKRHAFDTNVSHQEYVDIITRKTALPIMGGAKIIGLIAGARLEDIEAVGEYGLNLGIAFQIVDDILDVVGDGARLGKRTGTDLREGNVTLVAIHALNDGSSIDVRSLERLIAKRRKREEDVHNEEVRAIFPTVTELEDVMDVPYRVREIDTPVIRIWSPNGRRYDIPFRGFTVRRDRMDQGIAAQAVQEGAELMTETTVVRVRGDEVETNRGTFQGKVVVGSDGPRSTVAKSVGLEWPVSAPAMSATAEGDFSDATDMFFGNLAPGGYAWIIPKAGCANVGLGTWERFRGNLHDLFNKFVAARGLQPGKATGGFVPVLGPPSRTVKENVMLVGDAAGMVMATNGGGNNVAMIAGRYAGLTAADHLLDGTPLDAYETRWRTAVGGPLAEGVRIKRFADRFFGSDRLLDAAMMLLGRRRMARAIRCQRLFIPGSAKVL